MIIKLFNSLFIAIIIKTFYYAIFITNTEVKLLVIRHNIN